MRTPDEARPHREGRPPIQDGVPVELSDLLARDSVWATPPPDLLDDVLADIERQPPSPDERQSTAD